ncbi:MAG: GHMP kinase [Phycisphaerae bacterium]|nr:GHMP kinase [Phycisphaerae bacterium]
MDGFLQQIRRPGNDWFDPGRPILVVRAPARLDVMGGIADYTGSLVLEMPLQRAVVMAIQARDDQEVVIHSLAWERPGEHAECRWTLSWLYEEAGRLVSARRFSHRFDASGASWAKYVAGVFYVLLEESAIPHFGGGATIVFDSDATPRAGIGSSAALEVATYQAIAGLYQLDLTPLDAARICQKTENRVVGAPCGIMDQVTSLLGRRNALLQLQCQPHELQEPLPLPEGVTTVGINSGVKHQVSGTKYAMARVAAFMGHRIILNLLQPHNAGPDPTRGYLANVQPEEYVERFRDRLPTKIRGDEFLRRYGNTIDPVTEIDPNAIYKVRSRTEHHIYENRRVHQFASHLARACRTGQRQPVAEAGLLMYASHWSYGQRCGLGAIETDRLTTLVRERGQSHGFYGAKVSGGGAGGTVVILMDDTERNHAAIDEIANAYQEQSGLTPEVFRGSSDGATTFGHQHVT